MLRTVKLSELAAIIYVLLEPVLIIYGWSNLSFSKILIYILVIFYVFKTFRRNQNIFRSLPKLLTVYFIWLIVCNYISLGPILPLGNILVCLMFCTIFSSVTLDKLIYLYKIIAIVAISLFVLQEISYYTTGSRISGIFQFLPMSNLLQNIDVHQYMATRESINRSASFFSEPAHFAQFLLPLLTITLFKAHNFKTFIFPVIIVIVLLLLQSGNALIGLLCISFVYILKLLDKRKLKYKLVVLILLGVGGLTTGYYLQSNIGKSLLERQDSISGEMNNSSGFFRIYRGYYVFAKYSAFEKIVGINNMSTIKQRRDASKISFLVEGDDDLYFNCFQHFLLRTGFIGAIIFLLLCRSLWRNNTYEGKAIILTFFVLSFVASLYLSSIMMLYIFISYNLQCEAQINRLYQKNSVI